jgi:hypothetical protein
MEYERSNDISEFMIFVMITIGLIIFIIFSFYWFNAPSFNFIKVECKNETVPIGQEWVNSSSSPIQVISMIQIYPGNAQVLREGDDPTYQSASSAYPSWRPAIRAPLYVYRTWDCSINVLTRVGGNITNKTIQKTCSKNYTIEDVGLELMSSNNGQDMGYRIGANNINYTGDAYLVMSEQYIYPKDILGDKENCNEFPLNQTEGKNLTCGDCNDNQLNDWLINCPCGVYNNNAIFSSNDTCNTWKCNGGVVVKRR